MMCPIEEVSHCQPVSMIDPTHSQEAEGDSSHELGDAYRARHVRNVVEL
jgi:hypothetical protein